MSGNILVWHRAYAPELLWQGLLNNHSTLQTWCARACRDRWVNRKGTDLEPLSSNGLKSVKTINEWLAWCVGGEKEHSFGKRYHLAFGSQAHEPVKQFHEAALAAGGTCNGPPGFRAHYHPDYFGETWVACLHPTALLPTFPSVCPDLLLLGIYLTLPACRLANLVCFQAWMTFATNGRALLSALHPAGAV